MTGLNCTLLLFQFVKEYLVNRHIQSSHGLEPKASHTSQLVCFCSRVDVDEIQLRDLMHHPLYPPIRVQSRVVVEEWMMHLHH